MSVLTDRMIEMKNELAALGSQRRQIQARLTDSEKAYHYVDTGQESDRHYGSQILEQIDSRIKVVREELASLPSGQNTPVSIRTSPIGADESTYHTGS